MKELKDIQEIVDFLNQHEIVINEITETIESTPDFFGREVMQLAKNKVEPDSEQGKSLVEKGGILRNFGQKILNLFTIEFKITFAGVVLCHFQIPKIRNNKVESK